jgi:hypothetical protein
LKKLKNNHGIILTKKKYINKMSPCIGLCKLDIETGFCIGCLRTGEEIAMWPQIDNKQIRYILEEIKSRTIFKTSSS